ncbi:MAG: class I SAM-dependent methyltransferase [Actinobacteria bacterium]|nr:class I SAM-dependent methyltransferase [Actinomycetota bacterium]
MIRRWLGNRIRESAGTMHIAARLDELSRRVDTMDEEISAVPFVADLDEITVHDPQGRRTFGFSTPAGRGSGYVGFEALFRGTAEFVRERQRVYVPLLQSARNVVDLGSGRGELLDLLRAAGVDAYGVDSDEGMASVARAKGHDVVVANALAHLATCDDASLGAIVSLQFVEHVRLDELVELLALATTKLEPGGVFIAETVNPHSLPALKTFWIDLTHHKPIFPEALVTLCRDAGFASAYVMFPNGVGDLARDRRIAGEYAVIAYTASP